MGLPWAGHETCLRICAAEVKQHGPVLKLSPVGGLDQQRDAVLERRPPLVKIGEPANLATPHEIDTGELVRVPDLCMARKAAVNRIGEGHSRQVALSH